jgi:hypothetical protein
MEASEMNVELDEQLDAGRSMLGFTSARILLHSSPWVVVLKAMNR